MCTTTVILVGSSRIPHQECERVALCGIQKRFQQALRTHDMITRRRHEQRVSYKSTVTRRKDRRREGSGPFSCHRRRQSYIYFAPMGTSNSNVSLSLEEFRTIGYHVYFPSVP